MNSTLGDALEKAFEVKKNDYSNFVWKGEKQKDGDKYVQSSIRMIDMTPNQLKKCYDQCNLMLYNSNSKNLGRYLVLEEVQNQIEKCNVELFLRYCENVYLKNERSVTPRRTLYYSLREFIKNTNQKLKEQGANEIEDWSTIAISSAASNLPEEFRNIPISDVLDGCIDYLG